MLGDRRGFRGRGLGGLAHAEGTGHRCWQSELTWTEGLLGSGGAESKVSWRPDSSEVAMRVRVSPERNPARSVTCIGCRPKGGGGGTQRRLRPLRSCYVAWWAAPRSDVVPRSDGMRVRGGEVVTGRRRGGLLVIELSTAILMSSLVAMGGPRWWPSEVLAVRSWCHLRWCGG